MRGFTDWDLQACQTWGHCGCCFARRDILALKELTHSGSTEYIMTPLGGWIDSAIGLSAGAPIPFT